MAVGARTGRDGIHGASFASEDLSESSEAKRPMVQVGDPFTEKLLLEASLELIRSGHIVAIQDMGAAGLTSSSAEMAERGDVGVTIDVTKVPVREQGMTPYEILLSESQERMLVVARQGHEDAVRQILAKWDLEAAVIGEVIAEPVYRVTEGETIVAEFPGSRLVTECPQYVLEPRESEALRAARARDPHDVKPLADERDHAWTLERLLSSPTIASKRWVWQQYDSTVRTSTVRGPGSDAAVVRLRSTDTAIALCIDGNGRHVALSPRNGGRAAVCEAARNVACSGARPKAITNNLNFGNPKKPEVYFQLSEAIAGMGEACTVLETPVTGGNVSLYNENPQGAIHPTPTIGMVGVIESLAHITPSAFQRVGDAIVLLGECTDELGASEYLLRVHGLTIGEPPACNPATERSLIDALLEAIAAGVVRSAHDCSDGGLAVALAECAMMARDYAFGFAVDLSPWTTLPHRALLFGEAHGRVVVSTADSTTVLKIAQRYGVPARVIGRVTEADTGASFTISDDTFTAPINWLAKAFHEAIPQAMDGDTPAEHVVTASHAPTND
jgi:phosphoribosylformylglycinamidine synthase